MLSTPVSASTARSCAGRSRYGPSLPNALTEAVDDAGIAPCDLLVTHAEPVDDTGPKRLHEHVGGSGEAKQALAIARLLQVQHDALLAAIQVPKEHRRRAVRDSDLTARIALGRLDLDDLGAVIREREREIRARQEHREIDDAKSRELHRPGAAARPSKRVVVRAERRSGRHRRALAVDLDRAREHCEVGLFGMRHGLDHARSARERARQRLRDVVHGPDR